MIQILQNLEVDVDNVYIRLEDTHVEGCPVPLALGVTARKITLLPFSKIFQERYLHMVATEEWGKIPLACDDATLIDQFVGLEGFTIYTENDRLMSLMTHEVRRMFSKNRKESPWYGNPISSDPLLFFVVFVM